MDRPNCRLASLGKGTLPLLRPNCSFAKKAFPKNPQPRREEAVASTEKVSNRVSQKRRAICLKKLCLSGMHTIGQYD